MFWVINVEAHHAAHCRMANIKYSVVVIITRYCCFSSAFLPGDFYNETLPSCRKLSDGILLASSHYAQFGEMSLCFGICKYVCLFLFSPSSWGFLWAMDDETLPSCHKLSAGKLLASLYGHFFFFSFFSTSITFSSRPYSWEILPSTSFWTSRGHKCPPFSPPVRAFIFCRA